MIIHHKLTLALTLVLTTAAAKADPFVYTLGDGGQFGTVNLANGSFAPIGPGIPVGTGGLVQGPGSSFLSLGFDGNLYSITPAGALSLVGATGMGDCSLPTSPCPSNSTNILGKLGSGYYATDLANNLYAINPTTGASTLIGATGIPPLSLIPHTPVAGDPDGSFYVYDESLFSHAGKLYANLDTGIFDPTTFTPTQIIAPSIYQIDTTTGIATSITPTDFGLEGITDINGTVYAFDLPLSSIVTLNLTDGNTTYVADADPNAGLVGGATPAATPEPASLALVGSGLAALALKLRKKQLAGL